MTPQKLRSSVKGGKGKAPARSGEHPKKEILFIRASPVEFP